MVKTKWERIAERKRAKKLANILQGEQLGLKYRPCGLCGKPYCANNYRDRKVRVKKWHGVEICPYCKYHCIQHIPKLMELGILKFTKGHKK